MDRRIRWTVTHAMAMALVSVVALSTVAQAQRAAPRRPATKTASRTAEVDGRKTGFVLGVYSIGAPGVTVGGPDLEGSLTTGFGLGAGVMVGYGFNRTFSGYASADVAKQNASGTFAGNFGLRHLELGVRANLPYGDGKTVPYVSGSLGRRALGARVIDHTDDSEYNLTVSGGMLGIGGGVQHAFSPTLSLDSGLQLGFGRFGHYNDGGDQGPLEVNGSTTIRLRVGVTWRPSSKRST